MTDKLTVRMVVGFLGGIALAIIIGAIVLALDDHEVPGELWTMAGGALGGLSALLARTSTEPSIPLAPPLVVTSYGADEEPKPPKPPEPPKPPKPVKPAKPPEPPKPVKPPKPPKPAKSRSRSR